MRTERTSGRYITEDTQMIAGLQKDLAATGVEDFVTQMKRLGLGRDEVIGLIKEKF